MVLMVRIFRFFVVFCCALFGGGAGWGASLADYVNPNTYNNMYPYMTNSMRTSLNTGQSPSNSNAQINVLTRTTPLANTGQRRVVSRSATTARSATVRSATGAGATRVATTGANTGTNNTATARRVVQRTGVARAGTTSAAGGVVAQRANTSGRVGRSDNASVVGRGSARGASSTTTTTTNVSSSRCLADYTECMNGYCQREDTEYNRCYCSARLAQIDSEYRPAIEDLITQILMLQNESYFTEEEMEEYWMEKVGQYSGGNSWARLEDALNINWVDTESRVRGQQAFLTGHDYCVQHLQGCYYMASNLRDAYRSQIARDCDVYETSLQKLKNAATSIVQSYQE